MKFTVLPVLVAFLIGLACMPGLNIYQICAWNCGTVKTEPWRSKLSALAGVPRMVALFTRCRTWLAELTDVPLFASQIGAVGNIKQLLQDEADPAERRRAARHRRYRRPRRTDGAASGASSGNAETGGLLVRNEWNTSLLTACRKIGKLAPKCFSMPSATAATASKRPSSTKPRARPAPAGAACRSTAVRKRRR
jgi:hypothetical protein